MDKILPSPKVPQVTAPPPVADETAINQSTAQKLQMLAGRSGRASTILTDNDSKLGG